MKKLALILICSLTTLIVHCQVEQLIVETYYVSDENDETDTLGGGVAAGSVTYRIYLDLAEGNILKSIYGSNNHPLIFASTEKFFNNIYRDRSFGYQVNKNNLDNNTVAIDTWLTMGFASNQNFGVLKSDDEDGSIVGGINSDGGSALIGEGILANSNPTIGIPLTEADGLIPAPIATTGFFDVNFLTENGDDSTIFSSLTDKSDFTSYSARLLHNPGISAFDNDNKVLIAQLTTRGELSFELNVEIEKSDGSIVNYVANELIMGADTFYSNWLKYPLSCGCTDPNFLEFDKGSSCDDGSCVTQVVFGCTDPAACNYDPNANSNLSELCCYNSQCALLLDIVCPGTVYGCTDPNSLNYNPEATSISDLDTCCYIGGCMDSRYLEYNPDACFDDGSYCKVLILPGCMDMEACNYNPFANISIPNDCLFGCNEKSAGTDWMLTESGKNEVKIFPNPVSDILNVEISDGSVYFYSIYNMYGKVIIQQSKEVTANMFEIDLKLLPDGIYFLKTYVDGKNSTRKIVKQSR